MIGTVGGHKVDLRSNFILDGRKPLGERHYYSSLSPDENVVCMDEQGRFINVERFSPVIYDYDTHPPAYDARWEVYVKTGGKNKKVKVNYPRAYIEWWYEQRRRCLEGYTVGGVNITGPHYFYLNFWRIKSKKVGEGYIAPRFLDLDYFFFKYMEEAMSKDLNLLALKRRQIGFSEKLAAYCAYVITFFPAAQALIVAGLEEYSQTTFNRFKMGYYAMSPFESNGAREFYKRIAVDNDEEFMLGFKQNGVLMGYKGSVLPLTTKESPQAVSGKTPVFALMEEHGINPNGRRSYQMLLPAMMEQGRLNGRLICLVATGGEMKAGVDQVMDMFYNPASYRLLGVRNEWEENAGNSEVCPFFPAWMYYVMDHDGNSYKEPGLELIERERKSTKRENLYDLKTQMPLTPSEAFSVSGNSPFNVEKLDKQRTMLISNNYTANEQWGRLEWIYGRGNEITGVRWVPRQDGEQIDKDGDDLYPILLIEHPERVTDQVTLGEVQLNDASVFRNLYFVGTDSYDKDKAATSDSKGSCSVFKGYLDANHTSMMHVARLTWRPSKKEKFYEMTARMCVYFGMATNLIEWSNISIIDWYKNNNFAGLLKERPTITYASIIESKVENQYGVDPNTKHVWLEHFQAYIEDYWFNIFDLHMCQRLMSYRTTKGYNCDETIGALLSYENFLDNAAKRIKVINPNEQETSAPLLGFIKVKGKITRVS